MCVTDVLAARAFRVFVYILFGGMQLGFLLLIFGAVAKLFIDNSAAYRPVLIVFLWMLLSLVTGRLIIWANKNLDEAVKRAASN